MSERWCSPDMICIYNNIQFSENCTPLFIHGHKSLFSLYLLLFFVLFFLLLVGNLKVLGRYLIVLQLLCSSIFAGRILYGHFFCLVQISLLAFVI